MLIIHIRLQCDVTVRINLVVLDNLKTTKTICMIDQKQSLHFVLDVTKAGDLKNSVSDARWF